MRTTVLFALYFASMLFLPSALAQHTVSVSGSTSVTDIMEVLAENYQRSNPKVFIEIQGTGSSAGIKAAKNGTSMFGMSSRELKAAEKEPQLVETPIALDGIAIVVNNSNKIANLSPEDVARIYRGEIKNWSQVGGENKPLVIVTRDTASGTRGAFEDIMGLKRKIKGKEVSAITPRAQVGNGNGVVKTIVANNPYAIGYISLGSVDTSLKAVKINNVYPSIPAVVSGDYRVARPFLLLNKKGVPSPTAEAFLTWILSSRGQQIVASEGYVPVN